MESFKKNKLFFLIFICLFVFSFFYILPEASASAGQGGGLPFDSWLEKFKKSITGPFASAASLVGMVGAGVGLIFGGDLNGFFRTMLLIILVMALIVGASNLYTSFFGAGAII